MESSPVQIACTQESSSENIDVVWDWNSPQAKKQPRKCQKRLLLHSPKIPLKRHSSGNFEQDFEKLKGELKSLREELAIPDHEESLQLSPIEEAEYKGFNNGTSIVHHLQEDEFDELMDDNINEQLFVFSQQVEEDLTNFETKNTLEQNNKALSNKLIFKNVSPKQKMLANDSFDDLVKSIDDQLIKNSPEKNTARHLIYTNSGRVEFYRTQSFEMEHIRSKETHPKICSQNEIEKKRLEALAKLGAKRKLEKTAVTSQCSSEEIEQKRLQALAKVESKRQQEIIERKRQEALKKLQMRRQKNATAVKSSLITRLT